MAKSNKFLDYVEKVLYDDLLRRVRTFCARNFNFIIENDDYYSRFNNFDYQGIDELNIMSVRVIEDKKREDGIVFDVIVNPSVIFLASYTSHHDYDSYTYETLWLRVEYTALLGHDKLEECKFIGVDIYDGTKSKNLLSGSLVPIIKKEEYEKVANEFLGKYYPEALTSGAFVDPYELAKRMGLTIIEKQIAKDASVFGVSFFKDTLGIFYDRNNDELYGEDVKENTIVIDKEANDFYSYNSLAITIIHECLHFYLHKKAFRFARIYNKNLDFLACKNNGSIENVDDEDDFKFIEKQANGIAPLVLVPSKRLIAEYNEELNHFTKSHPLFEDYMPLVIRSLAKKFNVTNYAIKKRLIEVGITDVKGVLEYIDGHYVRPYGFKDGELAEDETFTISFNDLANSGPRVLMLTYLGTYRFIENHLILNDKRYITEDGELTEYARYHLDECAVRFKVSTKDTRAKNISRGFVTFCYLCRASFEEDMVFDLVSTREPKKIEDVLKARAEAEKRITRISGLLRACENFGSMLQVLMRESGFKTIQELVDKSHLPRQTLNSYEKNEVTNLRLKPILAICIAFKLPPKLSDIILKATCGGIPDNSKFSPYFYAINLLHDKTIDEVNEYLINNGVDPLTAD